MAVQPLEVIMTPAPKRNEAKEQATRKLIWRLLKVKYSGKTLNAAVARVKELLVEYDGSYRGVYNHILEAFYPVEEAPRREPLEYCSWAPLIDMDNSLTRI